MRIAILGGTSQIAKDLTLFFSKQGSYNLVLFARKPEIVKEWLKINGLMGQYQADDFNGIKNHNPFDVVINFVGVSDPTSITGLGSSIFDITEKFDSLAIEYIQQHPNCKYIFLSSGAAYCTDFKSPVNEVTKANIAINLLAPQDWYGISKLHAETHHRSLKSLPIVDVRVFNYFSHTQNMSARFLITDIARSIRDKTLLNISGKDIVRDFLNPADFFQLISKIIASPNANCAVDCYTLEPISKLKLLAEMQERFNLKFATSRVELDVNPTGSKPFYYSLSRAAEQFGYMPVYGSMDGLISEMSLYLKMIR